MLPLNDINNGTNELYFDNNNYHATRLKAKVYIVRELATNQMYQGFLLTLHYLSRFYQLEERVNDFRQHCSSCEEFTAFKSMVIPVGTQIVYDLEKNVIFLLVPENGANFHETYTTMTMDETVTVIRKILKLMKLCHKVNLFFRDCKLQKFVQRSKQCALTDIRLHNPFELFLSDSHIVQGRHRFTPFWAPEMFTQPEEYDGPATDVWSFGVFIYRLFVGKYPFVDADPQSFMTIVQNCHYSPIPEDVDELAKEVVDMILVVKPEERPTVDALDRWIHHYLFYGDSKLVKLENTSQSLF